MLEMLEISFNILAYPNTFFKIPEFIRDCKKIIKVFKYKIAFKLNYAQNLLLQPTKIPVPYRISLDYRVHTVDHISI